MRRRSRPGRWVAAVIATVTLLGLATSGHAATLARGASGPAVAELNARLAELTYLPSRTTSSRFTLATHHAVVAFQKVHRLAADGKVGRRTKAALATAGRPRARVAARGRWLEVWRRRQVAVLVVDGKVRRTISVSTGKPGFTTPAGRFRVYRRERRSWSVPYGVWLPWAAYFNGGIALHGSPEVPAYAASHGCVRIPMPFARAVFGFARLGTPVHVF